MIVSAQGTSVWQTDPPAPVQVARFARARVLTAISWRDWVSPEGSAAVAQLLRRQAFFASYCWQQSGRALCYRHVCIDARGKKCVAWHARESLSGGRRYGSKLAQVSHDRGPGAGWVECRGEQLVRSVHVMVYEQGCKFTEYSSAEGFISV